MDINVRLKRLFPLTLHATYPCRGQYWSCHLPQGCPNEGGFCSPCKLDIVVPLSGAQTIEDNGTQYVLLSMAWLLPVDRVFSRLTFPCVSFPHGLAPVSSVTNVRKMLQQEMPSLILAILFALGSLFEGQSIRFHQPKPIRLQV